LRCANESTGAVAQFTNGLEPDARSREVLTFHRPEERVRLAGLAEQVRGRLRNFPPLSPEGLCTVQRQTVENLEESFAHGPIGVRSSGWQGEIQKQPS